MHAPTAVKIASLAVLVGCAAPNALQPTGLIAQAATVQATRTITAKPTIVLVHDAFADASGWQSVVSLLQQDGYKVVAVPNALFSLAGDLETAKQVGVAGNCPADAGPMRPASADAMVDRNGDGYVCTELIRSIAGDTLRLTVDNDSAQVETVLPEPYIGM